MSVLLLDDLLTLLAQRAGLTVGTDLFAVTLPEDAALATAIVPTGGPSRPYSSNLDATFQVLTRGPNAETQAVMTRAWRLYHAIYSAGSGARKPLRNLILSAEWLLLAIDAIQPPADAGLSEGGRRVVSFNLQVRAVRGTFPVSDIGDPLEPPPPIEP